jgi:hypothetical protein
VLLYIDPGSGSLIVQVIIGGALGVAFFFKDLKRRAAALFGKKDKSAYPPDSEADDLQEHNP